MDSTLLIVVQPQSAATRVLGLDGRDEMLRALLPPPSQAHPEAAARWLEALALWYQRPWRVVLSVAEDHSSFNLGLSDGFGFGQRTAHYAVEVREAGVVRHGRRLGGVADFSGLRRLALGRS